MHRGILMREMTSRSDNMSRGNKYDDAGNVPLASSSGRLWRGAHAELRLHRALAIETFVQPVTEVAIVIDGHARIDRRGNSSTQRFDSKPGTFCICPEGVPVDYLQSKGGNVKILHLYMGNEAETPAGRTPDIFAGWPYLGGITDPLVAQIGAAIAEEIHEETAGGELLLDALRDALIARISRRIQRVPMHGGSGGRSTRGLDSQRLARVLDFLASSIEETPSLADIANAACLSRYHFVRAFKAATGKTPYQYLSALRLDRARELLSREQESVDNIAYRLQFSNSANFCRAFKRDTGFSPKAYRNQLIQQRR